MLKPCPFCGTTPTEQPGGLVCCSNVDCVVDYASEWNSRPIEDKQADEIELLKEVQKWIEQDVVNGVEIILRRDAENERLKAKITILREGLQEVIDFTPNDTDWLAKPTRDECIKEIKHFAELALKDGEE